MPRTTLMLMLSFSIALVATPAFAQPPIAAPGTEGNLVVVGSEDPVTAAFLGHTASFSNDLFLELDQFGMPGMPGMDGDPSNDFFLFNNQNSPVGVEVDLGSFAIGTELIFRLHVNDTGVDFFTGPGSRNPFGLPQARVEGEWMPETVLVSFEDFPANGPFNYSDSSFSLTNTTAVVPEPSSALLFTVGLLGALSNIRRSRRNPPTGNRA